MTTLDSIQTQLTDIFRAEFDDPSLMIRNEMTAADVEGWDSLSHINLIVAIERSFDVRFTLAEIQRLKDVGTLIDLISQKVQ